MEPLRGGFLTKPIPAASTIWEDAETKRSLQNGDYDGSGIILK